MSLTRNLATLGLIGTLAFASTAIAALKVGAKAPDFSAPAYLAGQPFTFNLTDALKKGPVVVYFFPAAHTSGCNVEAHLFSEAIDKFKAQHATVIGVTAGNLDELADFSKETEHCGGKFAVAADSGAKIAKQYDALLKLKPGWSDRTSYVIAQDGTVAHAYSAMSPNQHVKETLDALSALAKK
ncbi:peroxiredoxin [Thermomonas sp.]|uniref:peroxiredoxin n=1 Tax=Thermomonas sp. TaxID=1971895 RepID=UPI002487080B|nr:peroxiredoxin [Thermomonas sp.]MDI1253101.1 peroxiredoxin [Thermomonas sp.]